MKRILGLVLVLGFAMANVNAQIADKKTYLEEFVNELHKKWPNNKTQNLVFHGHSVPTGYFTGGDVCPFESYPHYVHFGIKEKYPFAVVNCIRSSIGGENAKQGAARFEKTVLNYLPDVLFIDYSLNDRGMPLEEARAAWASMIEKALDSRVKVILLTPTPDTTEDILDDNTLLAKHAEQVRALAEKYHVGLVDSYALFKARAAAGEDIKQYMEEIKIYLRGHNLYDIYYGRYKENEQEILRQYIDAAPREDFADILDPIDSFLYFESRKKH